MMSLAQLLGSSAPVLAQLVESADVGAEPAVVGALIASVVLGVATFLAADRLEPRLVGALGLLAAISAGFGLFVVAVPSGNEIVGLVVFAGLFVMLRLLSRFESVKR
jgi:hypothetical protein